MLFNSLEFLFVFLPVVFITFFLLVKMNLNRFCNFWLLLASLFFYSYYNIKFLPIMIFSILLNYFMGIIIEKQSDLKIKKAVFVIAILGNLLLLGYFKYFNFIIETLNSLSLTHFNTMKLLLPLGISFFTFQQISYVTDIYKGTVKSTNIIDYSLFVSFFPQLIAGPICTYQELLPQFQDFSKKVFTRENIYKGIFLIVIGLSKKVLLADAFVSFIRGVIDSNSFGELYTAWSFALSVALQGYFDFSGYCDMALGLALLFNINLPINFDSPYKSKDISDYWRRWHVTMGRFLKYHVYIPLGGSRRGTFRTYLNLFFIFFVVGLWHGANWCCILYGCINGVLVCINKFWRQHNIVINDALAVLITFVTMVSIAPLMMIKHVQQYFTAFNSMIGRNLILFPTRIDGVDVVFQNSELKLNLILLVLSLIIVFCFKNSNELAEKYQKSNSFINTFIIAVLFVVSALSITKGSEFIYFQF